MAAAPVLIPDDQFVYRGMRNSNWVKGGRITYRAFLLRPASNEYPLETELSLGLTARSAVDELQENHGVARLAVREVHALPHNLRIEPDPADYRKAYMQGLPTHSTEIIQRDAAMTIATDLSRISVFEAVEQAN